MGAPLVRMGGKFEVRTRQLDLSTDNIRRHARAGEVQSRDITRRDNGHRVSL